ncbi:MAG: hypothetical protein KF723_23005 [Rhizobiaceae bacterium]|nr:hypothetical protein [Rhizobiaceae bacterium]
MTPLALLVGLAGLSQSESAAFLKMSPSSIDKMSRGVRSTPPGILEALRALIERQAEIAGATLDMIEKGEPETVELGYPADDHEAQSLGWPCVSAWAGMAARIVAESPVPVRLVPRGTTVATAAAVDIHDRHRR